MEPVVVSCAPAGHARPSATAAQIIQPATAFMWSVLLDHEIPNDHEHAPAGSGAGGRVAAVRGAATRCKRDALDGFSSLADVSRNRRGASGCGRPPRGRMVSIRGIIGFSLSKVCDAHDNARSDAA